MGDDLLSQVNWYLAVQDGMTTGMVAPHAHSFSGIFLGGSDDFKLTADVWAAFSHSFGLKFHYARAGTINKLRHALRVGASSIDSSTPVQNGDDVFNEFAAVVDGTHPQLELFS